MTLTRKGGVDCGRERRWLRYLERVKRVNEKEGGRKGVEEGVVRQ
jgi:hypothetical protein